MGRMSKPNEAMKDFFKDNEVYEDAFNAVYFEGVEFFKAGDLSEGDTAYENSIDVGGQLIRFRRFRDIVRISSSGVCFVILCIEDQSLVHHAMPLKEMVYDSLGYLEQIKTAIVHYGKTKWTSDEYLSRFPRGGTDKTDNEPCDIHGRTGVGWSDMLA